MTSGGDGTVKRGINMHRVTAKPWFGPRRFGWGWSPVSWQGWLVTLAFLALMGGDLAVFRKSLTGAIGLLILIGVLVAVCYLTGGKPGGPTAWRQSGSRD